MIQINRVFEAVLNPHYGCPQGVIGHFVKAGVMTSRFGIGRPNQTNGKKQTLRTSAMKTPTKPRRNPGDPNADIVNAG
ncbi:hypothetical protein [Dictyobacter kobayashii]|uniref:Uncharacterized protein n=1 Tax=Dictyobacter kobayashii TaxID=2014872 RepID=A0A402AHV5_9CHLR|nr:hypothetical protein [Dictyobacter kobayashii]GCE18700.1 hypothetical protein KDK_25000 [Dictyobacter kobayashii]